MPSIIETYSGSGIYFQWDWSSYSDANSTIRISRSDYGINGPWTVIDEVDYPEYAYIDLEGTIDSYYLLEELDATDTVLYTHPTTWGEEALLRADIYYEIKWLQNLKMYRERLMSNRDRTVWRSVIYGWNLDPEPEIWIGSKNDSADGGKQLLSREDCITDTTEETDPDYPDGLKYSLDYNGKVYFWDQNNIAAAIKSYDDIHASFSFKLFSSHQINEALNRSLYSLVSQPGILIQTTSLNQIPVHWDHVIIVGAMAILMRQAQNMLLSPEGAAILSIDQTSPKSVEESRQNQVKLFSDKYREYQEEFDKLKEKVAIERYPTPYIITTPEFMLPGGRTRYFRDLFKS